MPVKFNTAAILKKYSDRADKVCTVVGAQSVTWAAEQLTENGSIVTSNLINSITYSTDTAQGKTRGSKTNGTSIEQPTTKHTTRIGTNVVYGPRVEFGFSGKDKLGRTYNQKAKSYLRVSQAKHKVDIHKIALRGMGE
jgi:hypothetical protein